MTLVIELPFDSGLTGKVLKKERAIIIKTDRTTYFSKTYHVRSVTAILPKINLA